MTSRNCSNARRALSDLNVVGADVVEVSLVDDDAQLTGIAASHVLYELVTAMAAQIGLRDGHRIAGLAATYGTLFVTGG